VASKVKLAFYARSPRRWAFGAYFSNVARMSQRGEMHIRRGAYVGVAPLPGGLTNVSVVLDGSGALPIPRVDQQGIVRRTLEGDAVLRDRFACAMQVSPVTVLAHWP
jgi:hypothetical protein